MGLYKDMKLGAAPFEIFLKNATEKPAVTDLVWYTDNVKTYNVEYTLDLEGNYTLKDGSNGLDLSGKLPLFK